MDYSGVDIIVSLNCNGNVDAVYTLNGGQRVAILDNHWDDQDRITEAVRVAGMSRDEQDKFKTLIDAERRHYHVGNMDRGEFRSHKELDNAITDLQECVEEAGHKENFSIYACVDDCEGVM